MTFVALLIPDWPTGAAANDLLAPLLAVAPRAAIAPGRHLAWLDARGLDPVALVERAREALDEMGMHEVFAGVAGVPCVAEIIAKQQQLSSAVGHANNAMGHAELGVGSAMIPGILAEPTDASARPTALVALFRHDHGRRYLAPLPLDVLDPSPTLFSQFTAVGLQTCGDLARLTRESVEVRFGREGLVLWKLSRADDPRPIFSSRPRELPNASIDWTEFSTTDLEQLVFALHSLLRNVCDAMTTTGIGARSLTLTLSLENRTTIVQPVGGARPTAQRTTWLRLMRRALERLTLPDRVAGIAIQVDAVGAPAVRQGDLFDLGFASAQAAESAVAQVMDLQGDAVVMPLRGGHALMERRVQWVVEESPEPRAMSPRPRVQSSGGGLSPLGLGLRAHGPSLNPMLLPSPREITVITTRRRGFVIPVRYTDNAVPHPLKEALGPHCIAAEPWSTASTREYHQGVRADGVVVLLFRDAVTDAWYLAGWWD